MQHSRDVPFRLLTSGHNQEMMPSSAAAVEFAGPRQVRVAAVALPEPGPDEVVVTTHFSGISGGTELLAYRGEIDPGVPLDDRVAARGPRRPASPAARRLHSGHRARERRGGHAYRPGTRPAPRPPGRGRQRRQLDGPQGGAGAARRTGPPPPRPGHAPPRRPGRRRAGLHRAGPGPPRRPRRPGRAPRRA